MTTIKHASTIATIQHEIAKHEVQILKYETYLQTLKANLHKLYLEYDVKLEQTRLFQVELARTNYVKYGTLELTGCTFTDGGDISKIVKYDYLVIQTENDTITINILTRTKQIKFTINLTNEILDIISSHGSKIKLYYIGTVEGELIQKKTKYSTVTTSVTPRLVNMSAFKVFIVHLEDDSVHLFHLSKQMNYKLPRYIGHVTTPFTTIKNIKIDTFSRDEIQRTTSIPSIDNSNIEGSNS